MKGTVKWFCDKKGFGFIQTEENDYFCHHSSIIAEDKVFRTLREDEVVEFDAEQTNKGWSAVNVKRLFDED